MYARIHRTATSLAVLALIVTAPEAHAIDAASKCELKKLKEAGRYSSCRLKAESNGVKSGEAPDFTKCDDKLTKEWTKIEDKAGPGTCPSEGDELSIGTLITDHTDEVSVKLSGVRFEDCGDGTVVDHQSGLMWQKTDDSGGLTDKDNLYSWTADLEPPDGTLYTTFLNGLNDCKSLNGATISGGYAGHCDWRLPQVDELSAIVDCSFVSPCIDQSVFGITSAANHWTATTHQNADDIAWFVSFQTGSAGGDSKHLTLHARGVRAGSCP